MFLELIATFVAGIAGAGLVMLINHVLGGRLPRWFAPVAAGLAMLLTTISSEYSWFERTKDTLPDGVIVAQTVESKAFYRPWTYLYPITERFVAIDTATIQRHPDQPDMRLANAYFFGRWAPVNRLPVLTDCQTSRRAALTDGITFEDGGTISGAQWVTASEGDQIITTICGAG
ncbi:hypothetical protein GCM10007094_38900 [Pseudovibrio japonicus]|uniref:Uncharacterized protein n=1 Tax=Pseudovibrio japonicus TaxID=366534 RepID=A0ABQ3EUH4_9HYPH|nr:hypothetical protein [Pseudovibrio japonicus]GHB45675.1 hypothetical protein GCM10007094_38900 [Pseudovibrio japonicus]